MRSSPHVKLEVVVSIPLDNNPQVLEHFAELIAVFNQAMAEHNFWADIVRLKKGTFFLITKVHQV